MNWTLSKSLLFELLFIFPINLRVNLNWIEIYGGIEPSFIVDKRSRVELVECGARSKKILKSARKLPWEPKIPNASINLDLEFILLMEYDCLHR